MYDFQSENIIHGQNPYWALDVINYTAEAGELVRTHNLFSILTFFFIFQLEKNIVIAARFFQKKKS